MKKLILTLSIGLIGLTSCVSNTCVICEHETTKDIQNLCNGDSTDNKLHFLPGAHGRNQQKTFDATVKKLEEKGYKCNLITD